MCATNQGKIEPSIQQLHDSAPLVCRLNLIQNQLVDRSTWQLALGVRSKAYPQIKTVPLWFVHDMWTSFTVFAITYDIIGCVTFVHKFKRPRATLLQSRQHNRPILLIILYSVLNCYAMCHVRHIDRPRLAIIHTILNFHGFCLYLSHFLKRVPRGVALNTSMVNEIILESDEYIMFLF